ncbi:MAG: hypothetical protein RJA07_1508 [Bacteroidota bacterium]
MYKTFIFEKPKTPMMKKLLLCLLAIIIGIFVSSNVLQSHSLTPPAGQSCNASGCHNAGGTGMACNYTITCKSSILGTQSFSNVQFFDPNYALDTLTFYISVTGATRAGFQMYSSSGGNFVIVNPLTTAITQSGGIEYISHYNSTAGSNSWVVKWIPCTTVGNGNCVLGTTFHYSIVCDTTTMPSGGGGGGSGNCNPGCSGSASGTIGTSSVDCGCGSCVGMPTVASVSYLGYNNTAICMGDTVGFNWQAASPPYLGIGAMQDWWGTIINTSANGFGIGVNGNYSNTYILIDTNWLSIDISYTTNFTCMGLGPFSNNQTNFASFPINKKPKIPALPTIAVCNGNATTLGSNHVTTANPPLTYSWSPVSNINLPLTAMPLASPSAITTYQLQVKDGVGCRANAYQQVNISMPTYSSFNQTVCNNQLYYFNHHYLNSTGTYYDTLINHLGCDSIITLNLTVLPISISSSNSNQSICANQYYLFNNHQLNQSGTYFDTLINAAGCDSFITLNLAVKPISNYSFTQTICSNQFYIFNNHQLNQSGIYYDTLQNYLGCDSFITLHLIVYSTTFKTINQTICTNQFYTFNNQSLHQNGTYYDTLLNHFGCDSFITLHLSILPVSYATINQSICNNQSYNLNGTILNQSGIFYDTIQNHFGCDSFITLHLNVKPISNYSFSQTICSNQPYLFNNHNLNQTGTYYDTLQNYVGCDSFITLHLNVKPISNYSFTQTICSNQYYSFNNHQLNQTGIYYDTLQNYVGCDSFITLHLIVNPISNHSFTQNICNGSSYSFNGNNLTTAGIYYDTLQNYLGCDSFITLHLNVNQPSSNYFTKTICNNSFYNLNGTILNQSGIYYDTIQNHSGCDSFITLHLIVKSISSYSYNQTICSNQPVYIHNNYVNTSGIYHDTLINYMGCDSLITLHLTVKPATNSSFTKTICSNNPFLFNGHLLNTSGNYKDTLTNYVGCDSIINLHLISHTAYQQNTTTIGMCKGDRYFYNGNVYTTSTIIYDSMQTYLGCDSIISITLNMITNADTSVVQSGNTLIAQAQHSGFQWYDCTEHQLIQNANDDTFMVHHSGSYAVIVKDSLTYCSDTSNCRTIVVSGVEDFAANNSGLIIYPNPTNEWLSINDKWLAINTIEITDVLGRVM